MEVPASFLRGGTSRSQYQNRSRASALCILWRILHFRRSWGHSKNYNMVLDLQELGLRFLVPMTSIFVNSQKNLLTFGDVCLPFCAINLLLLFNRDIHNGP